MSGEIQFDSDKNDEETQTRVLFSGVWPTLLADLQSDTRFNESPDFVKWLTKVMEENVPFGKQIRGLAVVHLFRLLKPDYSHEELKLSCILGWCCEIFQASCLIADDIMDSSLTRRGRLCWYKNENVGLSAINDSFMLENIMYQILRKYFRHLDVYLDIIHLYQDTALYTILGQSLDTRTSIERNPKNFNTAHYATIAKCKTGFYTFHCPVAAGMILAGYKGALDVVKPLMLNIGLVFQMQDDFLDSFGDPEITGKVGTDIEDCKCTWLMVRALEKCNNQQREILLSSIENSKPNAIMESVESVKRIYSDLHLEEEFEVTEKKSFRIIYKNILGLPEFGIPVEPFMRVLAMIYKRIK